MKLALTGGAGLFGRHCRALLNRQGVDHVSLTRRDWNLEDWTAPEQISTFMQGADAVIHAAACLPGVNDNRRMFDVNLRAVLNLAEWAQTTGTHLIFLSSASVYADPHSPEIPETARLGPGPLGGQYATSKRLAEAALAEFAAVGLKVTVLRPSSVYGAGMAGDQLIARLLTAAGESRPVVINGSRNRIDFLHAHDLCRAALCVAQAGALGTFNIASGALTSLDNLARSVAALCDTTVEIAAPADDPPPFTRFALDTAASCSTFGFQPVVTLQTGLAMAKSGALLPPDRVSTPS